MPKKFPSVLIDFVFLVVGYNCIKRPPWAEIN